jgi:hypothetical protein
MTELALGISVLNHGRTRTPLSLFPRLQPVDHRPQRHPRRSPERTSPSLETWLGTRCIADIILDRPSALKQQHQLARPSSPLFLAEPSILPRKLPAVPEERRKHPERRRNACRIRSGAWNANSQGEPHFRHPVASSRPRGPRRRTRTRRQASTNTATEKSTAPTTRHEEAGPRGRERVHACVVPGYSPNTVCHEHRVRP